LADPAGGGTLAAVKDVVGVAVGSSIGDEHRAAERQTSRRSSTNEYLQIRVGGRFGFPPGRSLIGSTEC